MLWVSIGEGSRVVEGKFSFVIVRSESSYNAILGRPTIQRVGIIVSTIHSAIRFQTPKGIGTIQSGFSEDNRRLMNDKAESEGKERMPLVLSCTDAEE